MQYNLVQAVDLKYRHQDTSVGAEPGDSNYSLLICLPRETDLSGGIEFQKTL